MYNPVELKFPEEIIYRLLVNNINPPEKVVCLVLNVCQVSQVPCIGQFVGIDNSAVRVFVYKKSDYMRADETGSTGNENGFLHNIYLFLIFFSQRHAVSMA